MTKPSVSPARPPRRSHRKVENTDPEEPAGEKADRYGPRSAPIPIRYITGIGNFQAAQSKRRRVRPWGACGVSLGFLRVQRLSGIWIVPGTNPAFSRCGSRRDPKALSSGIIHGPSPHRAFPPKRGFPGNRRKKYRLFRIPGSGFEETAVVVETFPGNSSGIPARRFPGRPGSSSHGDCDPLRRTAGPRFANPANTAGVRTPKGSSHGSD